MATKNYCFPDKPHVAIGKSSNGQYSNLNLNHNRQSLHADDTVVSKSKINDSRKSQNYGSINAAVLYIK